MGVRLNKILSELNIGLQTVVDFLTQEGIEVRSDITPNTKVTDEQYQMISEHFGGIRLSTKRWRFEVQFTDDPEENRQIVNSHHWHEFKVDTFMFLPNGGILIPSNHHATIYKFWTKEDLIEKCPNAIEGGLVIKNRLSAPSMLIPVAPYSEQKNKVVSQKGTNSQKEGATTPRINLNVSFRL